MVMQDKSKPVKVAIYTRVSTDEQTVENQVRVLTDWAANRGWEIIKIYSDTGSAFQNNDLVQQRQMLSDARLGGFKKILVTSLDRLTRKGSVALGSLLEQIEARGVHVHSMQQDWTDVPDALSPLLISIYGFFGKYESQNISIRTKAGMARAMAQGKHVGRPTRAMVAAREKAQESYIGANR